MVVHLSEEMRRALEPVPTACLITELGHEAGLIVKLDAVTVEGFRQVPVKYWYELGRFHVGAVLCLVLEVLDDPSAPYGLETFLNVASPFDAELARKLAGQTQLVIHFFDERLAYLYSKRLRHRRVNREELAELIRLAEAHNASLPAVDFPAARQRFMRERKR